MSKELDQLLTAEHFLHMAAQFALNPALFQKGGVRSTGNQCGNYQANRGKGHHNQRNPRIDGDHEAERTQNGDYAGEQLGKALQQAIAHRIQIVHNTIDDIPVGILVNEFQRHMDDTGKNLRTQVLHRAVTYFVGAQCH